MKRRRLRPVLKSDWWLIGPPPDDLDRLLAGQNSEEPSGLGADQTTAKKEHNAPVDHHIFQSSDGVWHLWACIRATKVGRILYHWTADDIRESPWNSTGEFFRRDESYGESVNGWGNEEWLQSPYFVQAGGLWYMFYGGHGTGGGVDDGNDYGDDRTMPGQICLMTSVDGCNWVRHANTEGKSRVFAGPGEVRDPCLLNVDGTWYCYYAGYDNGDRLNHGFYCRTSENLIDWSDYTVVHSDRNIAESRWSTECPHVVYRDGYYYLFRTENYYEARTHVFRSEDPLDFGIGDASGKKVGMLPVAAPEIYRIDGSEYVSSNHNPPLGTQLAELGWEEE
jgi:hypothetical protein